MTTRSVPTVPPYAPEHAFAHRRDHLRGVSSDGPCVSRLRRDALGSLRLGDGRQPRERARRGARDGVVADPSWTRQSPAPAGGGPRSDGAERRLDPPPLADVRPRAARRDEPLRVAARHEWLWYSWRRGGLEPLRAGVRHLARRVRRAPRAELDGRELPQRHRTELGNHTPATWIDRGTLDQRPGLCIPGAMGRLARTRGCGGLRVTVPHRRQRVRGRAPLAEARPGESRGFEHRLLSTEPEFAPLVLIDGHLQAVNTAAWYAGREIAVFAAVRERLGSRVMGEAYEAVVRDVFASVGPTGFDLAPSEALAPPPGLPADPDETDLVASTAQSMVIVEAKAYLPARTPRAVGNSYSDQLLHSRKQVRTRLAHWDQGWTFRGRPELPRDIDAYGLSVPIHDYGGSTWRGDSMREAEVDPCVVMPLQALALALSCMRTPDAFGRYLAFRLSLMRAPHAGLDELEPLIAWLAADGSPDAVPEYDHGLSVFRSYALPTGFQLGHPGPKDRDEWIELVYSHAEPLDGGSLHTKDGMVDVGELCERWSSHVRRALASGRPVSITRAADRATWSVALSSAVVRRVIVESTLIAATAGEVAPPSRASLPDPAMSPEHRAIRKEAKRLLRATSRQPHSSLPTPRSHVITSPETTTTLILEIVGQSRRPRN